MSSSQTEIPLPTILDLTKANARVLYGRHMTYDIITTGPNPRPQSLGTQKYDGQRVHALLVGYSSSNTARGKLLRGAYAAGSGRTAPTVSYALRMLYDETRTDVNKFVDTLVAQRDFAGGLMQERDVVDDNDPDNNDSDEIDGVTLRGD